MKYFMLLLLICGIIAAGLINGHEGQVMYLLVVIAMGQLGFYEAVK